MEPCPQSKLMSGLSSLEVFFEYSKKAKDDKSYSWPADRPRPKVPNLGAAYMFFYRAAQNNTTPMCVVEFE